MICFEEMNKLYIISEGIVIYELKSPENALTKPPLWGAFLFSPLILSERRKK